jgi:hypothetical protein
MLLAFLAAILVLVTAVGVTLAIRLKSFNFKVEFEGRNRLPDGGDDADRRERLPEAEEKKYLP